MGKKQGNLGTVIPIFNEEIVLTIEFERHIIDVMGYCFYQKRICKDTGRSDWIGTFNLGGLTTRNHNYPCTGNQGSIYIPVYRCSGGVIHVFRV